MASDDDYAAFLDKANQDLGDGQRAQTQKQGDVFRAVDDASSVPQVLRQVCEKEVYVSDADESFQAVSLQRQAGHSSGLPDEAEFAALIQHWDPSRANIDILDPLDWDREGSYSSVLDAVREAGRGNDVHVYRVRRDETRVEYWVVTWEGSRVLGVKALGVES